jgi:small membrane protein
MTLFQWLAGALMAAFAATEVGLQCLQLSRRSISSIRFCVWVAALILILNPSLSDVLASTLSIGRGVDVILYFTVIAFIISFFYVIHALEKQREQLTLLVRTIAITQPYATPQELPSEEGKIETS